MSKSAPPAPDYTGAAQATGQASAQTTQQQTYANRPNVTTPWSSQQWSQKPVWDPTTNSYVNQWAENTTLDPNAQAALNAQIGTQKNVSQTAQQLTGQSNKLLTTPLDWSGFNPIAKTPGTADSYATKAGDAAYQQYINRNQPLQDRAKDQLRTQLYNSGLKEGDPGYDTAMKDLENQQSDANTQASLGATQFGVQGGATMQGEDLAASNFQNATRQQQISEDLQKRGFTTNEINAMLTGQQVGTGPSPSFTPASSANPTNYLGAAQSQYGAALDQANASNANTSGWVSGLGSAAGMAAMFMF